MVVSNVFCFHAYVGKIPILTFTNIIQMGWNHKLGLYCLTVHLFVIYIHVHFEIGFNNLQ